MRRSARAAVAVIGAALVVGAAAPVSGATLISPAAQPGWRVVKSFGCGDGVVLSVASAGPHGVWATGRFTPCSPDASGHILVASWDGHSWHEPPLPPDAASAWSGLAIAGLSKSYSWTFGYGNLGTFAWLYHAGGWQTFQLPGSPFVSSAVAFSRSNTWAFGRANAGTPEYAARFNGRGWRRVGIPVQPVATAAPAPSNIWAVGPLGRASGPGWALAHWTGRWTVVPLPDPASGESISGDWVGWDNTHGAWVVANLVPTVPGGSFAWLLLHWTGSRWTDIRYPYKTFGLGPLAHDGHGGLWIASYSCRSCIYTDMIHYSPARGWSKPVPVGPVDIQTMRLIPGSHSVLAGGTRHFGLHNPEGSAVILKFGP